MKTQQAAIGKWRGVLRQLGMDERFLQNRHGPCPMCGGKDRYRFDDKDGKGTYFCSGCGPGDGMKLAMGWTGLTFKDTAERVDSMVGNIQAKIEPRPQDGGRIAWVTRNMVPAKESQAVISYLRGRGLPCSSGIFAVERMMYFEDGSPVGNFPAMVVPFRSASGDLITYHVTYINNGKKAPVSAPKKVLTPLGDMAGGSLRLCGQFETIGIAEGVETALAVMRDFQIPCWASATAGMMEKFTPPEGVGRVVIFGDLDESFTGQKAAYTLAHKLRQKGVGVEVQFPDTYGDFADKGATNEKNDHS